MYRVAAAAVVVVYLGMGHPFDIGAINISIIYSTKPSRTVLIK